MGTLEPSFRVTDVGAAVSSTSTVPPGPTFPAAGFVSVRLTPNWVVAVLPKDVGIVSVPDGSKVFAAGCVHCTFNVQLELGAPLVASPNVKGTAGQEPPDTVV